ncbi:hypothetical protein [Eubacterium aggregans]|uniref:hypothetical protein n=1 Tax=Eubacterium aggregans TaxID=81409 RepID=UPI003F370CFC
MKYYRLLDKVNKGTIVRQDDSGKYYTWVFGKDTWRRNAIMVRYTWCEDARYRAYKKINEGEALQDIKEQEKVLNVFLKQAQFIAQQAHNGQKDKGGQPYISHPQAVAAGVEDTEAKIVAWLHDICEDSDWEIEDLRRDGFPEKILEALDILTKPDGQKYEDYIARVKHNPLARRVKQSDLAHNMDLSRIPNPTEKDFKRFEKYKKAMEQLK